MADIKERLDLAAVTGTDLTITGADARELVDVFGSIQELQAEVARQKRVLRAIAATCNAPHWTSERRWKIEALASGREQPTTQGG